MNTFISYLNKITAASTILFFLLLQGCSNDPSAPAEEEKPTDTVTIGAEGGTVDKNGFKLTIPAGAFDGNYDISVSEIEDDGAFGENTVTPSFKVSGLPINYSKPINIKIKYTGQLSRNSFIAVGDTLTDALTSENIFEYSFHEAIDSAGFLVGDLFAQLTNSLDKMNQPFENSNSTTIKAVTDYTDKKSQHFHFHYPYGVESKMDEIISIFETNLGLINNKLNLSSYSNNHIQPVVVKYIESDIPIITGLFYEPGEFYHFLNVKYVISNNLSEIKARSGYKLLLLELAFAPVHKNKFVETILSWAEELFTDSQTFNYPENLIENIMEPFYGLANNKNKNHYSGLAPVLKFLTEDEDLFGFNGMKKLLMTKTSETNSIETLILTVNDNVVNWLPKFYKSYLNNEIYELPKNIFLSHVDYEWDINNNTDTLKNFDYFPSNYYYDLSAKLFKINVNYKPTDENTRMRLSVQGSVDQFGLYFHIFGIQNNELTFIESVPGINYYEIPNLKNSYDEFLVCVVNGLGNSPYTGESDIDLKIQIGQFENNNGPSEFDYNYCELRLFVNKLYEREDGSTFEQETIEPHSVEGEMIGNRFVAKFESYVFADTVEITLNETGDNIILLNWISWYRTESPSSTRITEYEAFGIPIFNSDEGIFKVSGIQTCAAIGHYSYYQNFQGNETVVKSFNCNDSSYFQIRLYHRE